jgi:DNA polymerase
MSISNKPGIHVDLERNHSPKYSTTPRESEEVLIGDPLSTVAQSGSREDFSKNRHQLRIADTKPFEGATKKNDEKHHKPSPDEDSNWPTIAIDTETYYDDYCSVKKLGTNAYTRHPAFKTLLISAAQSDDPKKAICTTPENFPWEILKGKRIVAHNAAFDRAVLKATPEAPQIPDSAWIDTGGMCAYHQLPRSLDKACEVLFNQGVSKDVRDRMKGKALKDLSQQQRAELIQYAKTDAVNAWRIHQKLAPNTPQHEIELMNLADQQGEYGLRIDRQALEKGITSLEKAQKKLLQEIPWVPAYSANSPKGLATTCDAYGIKPPTTTKKNTPQLEAWLKEHPRGASLIGLLQQHRTVNKTLKLLYKMEQRLTDDDILQFDIKYYGSEVTGRFSGAGGLNLLNLPKTPVEGVHVRNIIIPREGFKLAVADLSNIEVRTGAYLVKDESMLEAIRQGVDVYEAHARATMSYNDPRPLKQVDPNLRQLAKTRVLALGFQQGAERLAADKGFPLPQAKKIVREFRLSNKKIIERWRELEIRFKHDHKPGTRDFVNKLPSGRELKYFNVQRECVEQAGDRKWQNRASMTKGSQARREAFWGGKLYENECQALARDVFCHGLLAVARAGIKVLFTVHDELVAEIPERESEKQLARIIELMTTPPQWAKDLPLAAEGRVCDYYSK